MKRERNERATNHFLTVSQSIKNKVATIFVLTLAVLCIQGLAQAQSPTAMEQQCMNAVQGKVAWNQAGSTTWGADNLRNLCQGTTNPSATITCFQAQIQTHNSWEKGIAACKSKPASSGELVRASYDSNPYVFDNTITNENKWKWTGAFPFTRTIYNPLDGGILLKYTMDYQKNADSCSAGLPREKSLFHEACLGHDTNYDAPFPLAGFPGYPNGGSTGQDISDYLFYKDMQLINEKSRATNDGTTNFINDSAAAFFYSGVVVGGTFRGESSGKSILAKGGVVAVLNSGAYVMTLKVKWTAPDGVSRTAEVSKPAGQTAVIPLSIGAKNIEVECWAVAGTTIFTKKYNAPGMYAFTVKGTTLIHSFTDGLNNDVRNNVNSTFKGQTTTDAERTIKFKSEAGYVADMMVMYFVNQDIGGTKVPMPKTVATDKITAGVSRSIVIPKDIVTTKPIQVFFRGYGTVNNSFFAITVPTDFTGEHCFKAWGTIFSPQGGNCN
jgi:hypothetical protein